MAESRARWNPYRAATPTAARRCWRRDDGQQLCPAPGRSGRAVKGVRRGGGWLIRTPSPGRAGAARGDRTALELVEQYSTGRSAHPRWECLPVRRRGEGAARLGHGIAYGRDHGRCTHSAGIKDIITPERADHGAERGLGWATGGRRRSLGSRLREARRSWWGRYVGRVRHRGVPDPAAVSYPAIPGSRTWRGIELRTAGGIAGGTLSRGLGTTPAAASGCRRHVRRDRPAPDLPGACRVRDVCPRLQPGHDRADGAHGRGLRAAVDAPRGSIGGTGPRGPICPGYGLAWRPCGRIGSGAPGQPELFTAAVRALARAGATT